MRRFIARHYREVCYSVPTFFSVVRLAFVPFIIWAIAEGFHVLALFLFMVAAFTDFLDGFFAMLLKSETDIGAFLDPLCDKILLLSTLFALNAYVVMTPVFTAFVWIIFGIEIALILLRLPRFFFRYKVSASWYGKTKMFFEVVLVCAALLWMHSIGVMASIIIGTLSALVLVFGALSVKSRLYDLVNGRAWRNTYLKV